MFTWARVEPNKFGSFSASHQLLDENRWRNRYTLSVLRMQLCDTVQIILRNWETVNKAQANGPQINKRG